jgi:six-Cys-in-45 modification radical SAM protein
VIHQYINNGYYIVLDVSSGSVHVTDEVLYDAIAIAEPLIGEIESPITLSNEIKNKIENELVKKGHNIEDIKECMEDMQELINMEELFTKDTYETYVRDFKSRKTVVKALCLHIAHDCNLACKYCFAEEGEYHGRRALMSFEVGKKAIDFLLENSGNRRNLEVDFFGGEPLMNWNVVKQIVEYGRSKETEFDKKFRFTLTTNGMLLNDEVMEFANREMSNVVLSLDGRKEVNDAMRPTRGGKGSYDVIVPKFKKFAEQREGVKDYYIRGTFTRNNLEFSKDVIHFADLGFRQTSMEPVVGEEDESYAIRWEDIPKVKEEYDILAKEYIKRKKEGRGFNFFHFNIDLKQGPCVAKRLSGCGSGTEYLAVTPWGDFYPCHQFVGKEEFLLGNVDIGIVKNDICNEFKLCNVYAKPKCRDCFARFYCSGGCAANSYSFHGDITDTYDIGCELQKKRIECAIMIKAAMADE